MFDNIDLKQLTEAELDVYNYILKNPKAVQKMTVRTLAQASQTSTATIRRFCRKMKLNGFSELKYLIRDQLLHEQKIYPAYDINTPLTDFFTKVSRDEFEHQICQCLALVRAAKTLVYFGIGSSGSLADYGARFMSNAGGLAYSITDPFQPRYFGNYDLHDTLLIVLSVSGTTDELVVRAGNFKSHGAKVIAITNHENSPLGRLADVTVSYYMPERVTDDHINLTTQIPVVYLLETIAERFVDGE
ncbi:MurR/RpiR family transcriptional regulator [Lapidilactobacillus achengensis]|uniref:MurR/RpiR family transcriptional regulator n=1 Tax=Lapidilactobacillus achengensis TaxID=2486000 RepID=A0ABW1UN64_9LACO|nr:MurR/RpiR family transcriptional regulator [Lapidilactobacillus achengensis]